MQILEAVVNDSEDTGEDGRNGVGTRRNIQGGGAVGAIIWKKDMVGNRGDAQGPDADSSLGGTMDHGDDGEIWGMLRVGVPNCR